MNKPRTSKPTLSPGAKVRAAYMATGWRAQALFPVGNELGFASEQERLEMLELANLMASAGAATPGTPNDGRALNVLDVMQATGWPETKAARWVLAARDLSDDGRMGQPDGHDLAAVAADRVGRLVKRVRKLASDPNAPQTLLLGLGNPAE